MSSKDSRQTLTAIAAVIIIALLGITAFLLYSNSQKNKDLAKYSTEMEALTVSKDDVDKLFREAQTELDGLRSDNEEANQLIDAQQKELDDQKASINKLIRSGKASKSDLAAARTQLDELRTRVDNYVAEINTLKDQNMQLTEQTTQLTEEKTNLLSSVAEKTQMNESLTTEKAVLVSEKEKLQNEREKLSKKVNIASVVKVGNIHATALKVKESTGKEKETNKAKNTNRLRLCFNTTTNDVVVPGDEKFFIRLINPIGETMAIENQGSGVLVNNKTEEQVRYTTIKDIDYTNAESMYCTNWDPAPGIELQKGTYEIQVYNKGYLSGVGTVTLK